MWKRIGLVTLVRGAEKVLRIGRHENGIEIRLSYCESSYGTNRMEESKEIKLEMYQVILTKLATKYTVKKKLRKMKDVALTN